MPVQSITPTSYKSIVETTRSCPPSSVCSVCKSPDYVDDQRSALSSGCTFESIHVAHLLPGTQSSLPDVIKTYLTPTVRVVSLVCEWVYTGFRDRFLLWGSRFLWCGGRLLLWGLIRGGLLLSRNRFLWSNRFWSLLILFLFGGL